MLGQRAWLHASSSGGSRRGRSRHRRLERLRQFWRANPAAGRTQGTSCYLNLSPAARHYAHSTLHYTITVDGSMALAAHAHRHTGTYMGTLRHVDLSLVAMGGWGLVVGGT